VGVFIAFPLQRTICKYHCFFNKSKSKEQVKSFGFLGHRVEDPMSDIEKTTRISSTVDFSYPLATKRSKNAGVESC
jgi:hypothetical protein